MYRPESRQPCTDILPDTLHNSCFEILMNPGVPLAEKAARPVFICTS